MFGEMIKTRLREVGKTQADLARETGFSRHCISDWCMGKNDNRFPFDTVERLARALKLGRKYFYQKVSGQSVTSATGEAGDVSSNATV